MAQSEVIESLDASEKFKSEDFAFAIPDDTSSNHTNTEGGPINGNGDNLGFFRGKQLDLAKLVTSR